MDKSKRRVLIPAPRTEKPSVVAAEPVQPAPPPTSVVEVAPPIIEPSKPVEPSRFTEEGDSYRFELVRRTESKPEGWVRKLEVMRVFRDVLVKSSTVNYTPDGKCLSCSEALVLIPNVTLSQFKKGQL